MFCFHVTFVDRLLPYVYLSVCLCLSNGSALDSIGGVLIKG